MYEHLEATLEQNICTGKKYLLGNFPLLPPIHCLNEVHVPSIFKQTSFPSIFAMLYDSGGMPLMPLLAPLSLAHPIPPHPPCQLVCIEPAPSSVGFAHTPIHINHHAFHHNRDPSKHLQGLLFILRRTFHQRLTVCHKPSHRVQRVRSDTQVRGGITISQGLRLHPLPP